MRLNSLRRGGGGWILICSLLAETALGTKIQLDKRGPQPQGPPPPITVWVTVDVQGGWVATEFLTKTITETPTGLPVATSIATVTSIITTATTVTNTVTVQSTTTQTDTQTGTIQPTTTSAAAATDQPTVATITSFVATPTTTNLTGTWAQGAPVVRRQVPETVTSTTTSWNWASGTTTSIITVTTQGLNNFLVQTSTSMVLLTTTLTTTQVSTFTTEEIVTASASPSTTKLVVDGADPLSSQQNIPTPKTPNVEIIVGASFGAFVGFIGIFVLAYLWAKKRRDENLRKESVGFSTRDFSRSTPAAGAGVIGVLGSLRHGSSAARYNNLPTIESIPNMSPLPLPPQSPPPQLPSLRVSPPSGEFNYDYTFGSPVSSIDEAQLHALTSGGTINRMNTPPTESPAALDVLYYTLPRQGEELPWQTRVAVTETVVTETVVSSVSAESERIGSLRRKPLPGNDLVSP